MNREKVRLIEERRPAGWTKTEKDLEADELREKGYENESSQISLCCGESGMKVYTDACARVCM